MFSESEIEAEPEVETRTSRWANPKVVESSNSELEKRSKDRHDAPTPKVTPTKIITRSQTSQNAQSIVALPAEVGRKKHKSTSKHSILKFSHSAHFS
ncbi:hypothetical protein ACFX2I_021938 [Malus domestica]